MKRISVIGGGSWATALSKVFSESGVEVCWYLRSASRAAQIREEGRNPNYLSFLQLPMEHIRPVSELGEALDFSELLLLAVPSAYLEVSLKDLEPAQLQSRRLVVSIKGVVGEDNVIPTEFLKRRFSLKDEQIAVLGGPCHAEEIALDRKTYMTVASRKSEFSSQLAAAIRSPYIRAIPNEDPLGVEYAAILKNVVGIASGIAAGLNYGENFRAVLVSNALREVSMFLQAVAPQPRDPFDSAYFGDLFVTAYSEFSRNRTFGQMIGRGYTVQLARMQMDMVAEGYYAARGIHQLARKMRLELPVISAVYRILYNHISPYIEFRLLEKQLL